MPPTNAANSQNPQTKRIPIAPVQKWSLSGPGFTGPKEDVIETIGGMQSIPDEFAVAVIAAINSMDKTVRGVRLNIHYTSSGKEFHINGHATAIF